MKGPTDTQVARALGEEIRRVRETRGWSRAQLVALLPSCIGDRTLLSYEHGARQLTAVRLVEIGHVLGVEGSVLLTRALQRARLLVESTGLTVNLRALANDQHVRFRPMRQWALNTLDEQPDGVVTLTPEVVRHLALFVGCPSGELANHLAGFLPDDAPTSVPASSSHSAIHDPILTGRLTNTMGDSLLR